MFHRDNASVLIAPRLHVADTDDLRPGRTRDRHPYTLLAELISVIPALPLPKRLRCRPAAVEVAGELPRCLICKYILESRLIISIQIRSFVKLLELIFSNTPLIGSRLITATQLEGFVKIFRFFWIAIQFFAKRT